VSRRRTKRGEQGSAGLLAVFLAAAFGAAGFWGLSPALAHAEVVAAQASLQGAGQQLVISPPATVQQARATLRLDDPGVALASGPMATRSGLVGVSVGPAGWALAQEVGGTCVLVRGSASTGISESQSPISTGGCTA